MRRLFKFPSCIKDSDFQKKNCKMRFVARVLKDQRIEQITPLEWLTEKREGISAFPFMVVRQAWRVARKRERISCGGYFVDLAVQVRCRP